MEMKYQKGTPFIKPVKQVERGNFSIILDKIAKNLLRRGQGRDLAQFTQFRIKGFQKCETYKWNV